MSSQVKLRIPKSDRPFYGTETLSVEARAALSKLLDDLGSAPEPVIPPRSEPYEAETLWLHPEDETKLRGLMVGHGLQSLSQAVSALLHGAALASGRLEETTDTLPPDSSADTVLDHLNRMLHDRTRIDQARFFRDVSEAVMRQAPAGEVIFAEAATGIGKTRAFLATAIKWLHAHPGEHVVIASPSYSVMLQTVRQWRALEAAGDMPSAEAVAGMREFVSRDALDALLQRQLDSPDSDPVRAAKDSALAKQAMDWMDSGAPAAPDDPLKHAWTMRGLEHATADLWTLRDQVRLESDASDADPGRIAYAAQFHAGREASVIFCTHAMLATEAKSVLINLARAYKAKNGQSAGREASARFKELSDEDKKKVENLTFRTRNALLAEVGEAKVSRLPAIGLLIVDEAHLLESSFASVFCSGISMTTLNHTARALREAWPKRVPVQALEDLQTAWNKLRDYGRDHAKDGGEVDAETAPLLAESVNEVQAAVQWILSRLPKRGAAAHAREINRLRSIKYAIDEAVATAGSDKFGRTTQISWSPTYKWPRLDVGRYDVSGELDFLWTVMVQGKAVLVSATLYDDVGTKPSVHNLGIVLGVRQAATRTLIPVRPMWLYDPVTLYQPAVPTVHGNDMPRFRKPAKSDGLSEKEYAKRLDRWRADVTDYIADVYSKAKGGVLVLMTSHEDRAEIVKRLVTDHAATIPSAYVLTQSDGRSLEVLRREFLQFAHHNDRACLVAVGAAWTGLDLSDETKRPGHDVALTDLVIPLVPIAMNRSLTFRHRCERVGHVAIVGEAAVTFRQGVGRLVRRQGLRDRRLHVLDARINGGESHWQSTVKPAVRVLRHYVVRKAI
ncbi:MAG TPA: type IV CRISPR-associated DEAD/DEAH-box helicase Csf4 [Nevskiaceae bacterium]|nr:type IV CRISPR-associated DEAD/DEAH-box helicase Csf4 [Nevskiaceae bacterium]